MAAAGLAADRLGRKVTLVAALLQGELARACCSSSVRLGCHGMAACLVVQYLSEAKLCLGGTLPLQLSLRLYPSNMAAAASHCPPMAFLSHPIQTQAVCALLCPAAAAGGSLVAAALTRAAAVQRSLAVAARFGLAGATATLLLHSAELYPAVLRGQGLAASNVLGRAGTVLAPGLVLLEHLLRGRGGNLVPLVVAGGLCLAAAAAAVGLPETLNNPPPETLQASAMRNGRNLGSE